VERKIVNQIAAAHEQDMVSSGDSLHVTVKYNKGEDENVVSPKIVLEVIENNKEKRRIDLSDYHSPEHTALF
jgi:ATP-dependent Clp protease ATP-binding subunit ClpB